MIRKIKQYFCKHKKVYQPYFSTEVRCTNCGKYLTTKDTHLNI